MNHWHTHVVSMRRDCGWSAYAGMSMKPSSRTQKSASVNSLQRDVLPQPVEEEEEKKWKEKGTWSEKQGRRGGEWVGERKKEE